MTLQPKFIKSITQVDNFTFQIVWDDLLIGTYRLSELQKQCPCANCVDEFTGKRTFDERCLDVDVRAQYVQSVGRYAIKIKFTSGCSSGIYDFDLLYKMALKP